MTPKKVTDATKAKLPLPKNHPQKRPARKRPKGTAPNVERHLHPEPSPIAGQPLPANPPTEDAPTFRYVPCGDMTGKAWNLYVDTSVTTLSTAGYREPLYDTRPIPWSWDSLSLRRKVAGWLTTLAERIAP